MMPPFCSLMISSVLFSTIPSMAQQPTQRERDLEELVRRLADKVDRLEKRLSSMEEKTATPNLLASPSTADRVQELERQVQEMQEGQPLVTDSQEWAKIKAWANNPLTLRAYWKDALRFQSMDESIKLTIGGRIQQDFTYFAEDGDFERRFGSDFEDGTEFRRARIYISGTIYGDIEFKAQYDFAGGDADFKDVYVGLKNLSRFGNVRIGQFKEPFSLEELTSSNYITFMERSLVNTFAPGRNVGIMFHDDMAEGRMTWAVGIFRQTDSFGNGTGGRAYNATARLTALPIYEDGGKKLLHLGVSFTHQNYEDDVIRFRARPESHLSPRLADTGDFPAESGDFIGGEVAYVNGPFSLQGEYVHAFIEGAIPAVGDPNFWGASLQASYFLTGEHRPYKTATGTFTRVRPLRNYGRDGGPGAWEIAARLSYLNLNDGRVKGGRLGDLTLGLNWYLNPNVRTMWNYVLTNPGRGGDTSIFMWRVQIAF